MLPQFLPHGTHSSSLLARDKNSENCLKTASAPRGYTQTRPATKSVGMFCSGRSSNSRKRARYIISSTCSESQTAQSPLTARTAGWAASRRVGEHEENFRAPYVDSNEREYARAEHHGGERDEFDFDEEEGNDEEDSDKFSPNDDGIRTRGLYFKRPKGH